MAFDFDAEIDRRSGDSTKWAKYPDGVIPLWVADMDFAAPPAVIEALHERVDHGVFGYNRPLPGQVAAVVDYLACEFAWAVQPEWIVWLPGLVCGLNVACRAVGEPGDAVFTSTPIYPPFLSAPADSGRRVACLPLVRDSTGWLWDFPGVDAVLRGSRARLLLLCHPHNPTGRVWREDELWQIAALAEKHDVVVCSDEIHSGLVLDTGCRHRVFASLAPEVAARTITLMAPSKTFNIPGLGAAFAVISAPALRRAFQNAMHGIVPHVNALGMAATEAALRRGGDWHAALISYLRGNARAVERAVANLPGLDMRSIEATYLAWIDAREFAADHGIATPARHFESHGLGLSDGADFGAPGFLRLNFGTCRALLDEALDRLGRAVRG